MSARRRGHKNAEHHVDERWMASYMDMVTVLMCLFLVLFAMSSVDANKYQLLRDSLANGFGTTKTNTVDTAKGVVVKPSDVGKTGELTKQATAVLNQEQTTEKAIAAALESQGLSQTVTMQITAEGLTVHLVADTAFGGNSASLTPTALRTLSAISGVIAPMSEQISVEGHANPGGSPAPFASMWDLSAERAVSVVRFFEEAEHLDKARLSAAGYGDSRPLTSDRSAAGQAANRRVDVVVVSGASDQVRAEVVALSEAQSTTGASATPTPTPTPAASATTRAKK